VQTDDREAELEQKAREVAEGWLRKSGAYRHGDLLEYPYLSNDILAALRSVAAAEREAGRREAFEEAARVADDCERERRYAADAMPWVLSPARSMTQQNLRAKQSEAARIAAAIRERLAALDRRAAGGGGT